MPESTPTYLIKNARLVNEGRSYEADVLLSGGRIERIDDRISPKNNTVQIIDGGGKLLLPGVIDSQVHFREPGLTHKGDLSTESLAAVAGGVTSYIEQPNTVPAATTLKLLEAKFARAAEVSWANYSFSLGASNSNIDELKRASKRDVAAIKMFLGSSTGDLLVDDPAAVERIFREVDHQLIAHCEDEPTMRANLERLVEERGGREHLTTADHPLIRSEEACYLSSSRAVALARETGAHFHVYHVSTGKELDLFDAEIPLAEKKITAEACVHHLWFSDEDYAELGNRIKWNPAIKTVADRDALRAALLDGRIDVVATDHAPHTLEEKQRMYVDAPSGGPLIQNSLPAMLELARRLDIDFARIVELMCHQPAILFGIQERGFLREGYHADLVLVDPHRPYTVQAPELFTKSQWSPFEGRTFAARVSQTWVNGLVVYRDGKPRNMPAGQRLVFDRGW